MWEVKIEVEDRIKQIVRATATRTDDVTGEVYRYTCIGLIETQVQRTAMLNSIKNAYREKKVQKIEDENILAGLEDTATNTLNNWDEE